MIISSAAVRQADRLIELAADNQIDAHAADLIRQAQVDPTRMVELIVKLSERVALALPPRPTSPEELRRAHAAYVRGSRDFWVVEGERIYQRDKKRKYAALKKERRLSDGRLEATAV